MSADFIKSLISSAPDYYKNFGIILPVAGGATLGALGATAVNELISPTYDVKDVEKADLVKELQNSTAELRRRTKLLQTGKG